ncbi:lipid II flippase MurJ [Streptomyces sp. RFCAC02]|uniref:lipid II flippase MurJ n=1 Tax=Streptomyces sp. RFCAC02 TaxID=2499143 RepID=UPI001F0F06EC|nr:lipid II flippase MurJ [Streptomyces sp. RFCAC02]
MRAPARTPAGVRGDGARAPGRFVARAAAVTAALTAAGAACGLVRDQIIAHLFGAGGETDAFLVAWTVPEFASTLLIDDAMALVLVPAFSMALARGGAGHVRALLAGTFPRLLLALGCVCALLAAGAPLFVRLLAPGLADPALAVDCTRLTALSVLTFGIAGYFSAVLRAHRCFLPPASILVAYNAGIIAAALALHGLWGVRAAAAGVAVGGALMAAVQLPAFLRRLPRGAAVPRTVERAVPLVVPVVAPVALFAAVRQTQVLAERFLASGLPAGAISHLNYAQKVAQLPMVLSLMVCTVTLPLVARALADGDTRGARLRVERDLALAAVVVLAGGAYIAAYAPQIVALLFERGAFDPEATAATARVMRVYALGLLGHTLVGALVRPYFSTGRPTWYPAAAMAPGLLVTVAAGAVAARWGGAPGIAAANAAGITLTALLLLRGLGRYAVPVDARRIVGRLLRLATAAALAAGTGWLVTATGPATGPLATAAAGCLVVPAAFAAYAHALRAPEAALLVTAVRTRRKTRTTPDRRLPHAR